MEDNARLALLKKAIQFNTANGNEAPLAQWLQQVLAEHGIQSELVEFAPTGRGWSPKLGRARNQFWPLLATSIRSLPMQPAPGKRTPLRRQFMMVPSTGVAPLT